MYIDGADYPEIISFLESAKDDLKKRTHRSVLAQQKLVNAIRGVRSNSETSDEATAGRYDKEYEGKRPAYGYVSAILSQDGFKLITGLEAEVIPTLHIIDVGAGTNEFLRFCRDTLSIPSGQLQGSDVSEVSRKIIDTDGFTGYVGRIEDLHLPEKSFDVVYLSYFIDYDTNQAATFSEAIRLCKPGGKVVLEGLFPVRPFGLLDKDKETYSFVTKGITAEKDVQLVRESFVQLGEAKDRKVSLEKVFKTYRYVNSHYGFHKLPSYFLTFSVTS